jgi:hypothetical protein
MLQMASTADQVALRPFFGVYGPYTRARDPWSDVENRSVSSIILMCSLANDFGGKMICGGGYCHSMTGKARPSLRSDQF